jgi:uncharacterized protein YigE (DUF2233 family)
MKPFVAALFLLVSFPVGAEWKSLAPGLDYESRPGSAAHVLRIDPAKFRIGLLAAADYARKALTAEEYRSRSGALVVVNGGFFDENFRALGLLHRDGKTQNPLRNAAWGVFSVGLDGAKIRHRNDWVPKGVDVALQVGPRLVVDGVVQRFKEAAPDRRSAVGVAPDGKVVIAVSEKALALSEWAEILKRDCPNALNLDGGSSTQLAAGIDGWSLIVEGLTAVPNALAVFRPY